MDWLELLNEQLPRARVMAFTYTAPSLANFEGRIKDIGYHLSTRLDAARQSQEVIHMRSQHTRSLADSVL